VALGDILAVLGHEPHAKCHINAIEMVVERCRGVLFRAFKFSLLHFFAK
jgi:hypothetical protein